MKKYQIIFCIIFILFTSCQKFLDIKTEGQQVFIKTSQDCLRILDNYSVMNVGFPSDGEASAGDFYINDASYLASARTQEDRNIYTWQPNAIRNAATTQWIPCYFKIYSSNLVLEALDKLSDTPTPELRNMLRGAALFYRAFNFWQVAQLYTKPYNSENAQVDLGIPLRLNSDINAKSARSTNFQTYNQIITDLEEAANLLPSTVSISSRPSKVAAYAMLARVYLSMHDYDRALEASNKALQIKQDLLNYSTISKTSLTPFARFNNEVIFHAVMIQSQLLLSGITATNVAKVEPSLISLYDVNDLRKSIFFKEVSGSPGAYAFTGNYEPTTNGTYFVGLAVDELLLIRAECSVRRGDIVSGLTDLNALIKTRWNGTYTNLTATTADGALQLVLNERRKELLFRNIRWSDLRRLNSEGKLNKTLVRSIQSVDYTLPPNDLRYTLLIPTEVIINSGIEQNLR
jgi:tetratricopeptide (TPR) repeat protein